MRRMWLGVVILVLFLVLGLWGSHAMTGFLEPLSEKLKSAEDYALQGNMDAAMQLAQDAKDTWHRHWPFVAILADHDPMDEIDGHFESLLSYAKAGHAADFAALCGELSSWVEATADAQKCDWWNLV